jgi:hypothetical protein
MMSKICYHIIVYQVYMIHGYIFSCVYVFVIFIHHAAFFLYVFVVAPLDPNLVSEMDMVVNNLRVKYRTCLIEIDVENISCVYNSPVILYTCVIPFTSSVYMLMRIINICFYLAGGCYAADKNYYYMS